MPILKTALLGEQTEWQLRRPASQPAAFVLSEFEAQDHPKVGA
jgi:hypothetical protein